MPNNETRPTMYRGTASRESGLQPLSVDVVGLDLERVRVEEMSSKRVSQLAQCDLGSGLRASPPARKPVNRLEHSPSALLLSKVKRNTTSYWTLIKHGQDKGGEEECGRDLAPLDIKEGPRRYILEVCPTEYQQSGGYEGACHGEVSTR
ncbi:hypothetical protein J6590_002207 [Homalodisca vitripennis]|nr:hypothetical protein J6590_002207 [Homalodisca vitripennis]